jgi:hypothetical protein
MAEPASVMVTIDNTAPMITAEDMLYVMTGGMATISATLSEAAGTGSVTVALDGTAPVITAEIDMSAVMTGGEATISATLSEASTVTADVTALNEGMPTLISCTDAYPDGRRWRYGIRRRGHDHC